MRCLSYVNPKNKEHKHTEGQEIVNIIFVIGLGKSQDLPDGVGEHGVGGVELVVHLLQELVVLLHLGPNVYG